MSPCETGGVSIADPVPDRRPATLERLPAGIAAMTHAAGGEPGIAARIRAVPTLAEALYGAAGRGLQDKIGSFDGLIVVAI